MQRRRCLFFFHFALTSLGLAVSIALLLTIHVFWVQALNALFLAFLCGQIGLLGHGADYMQVSAKGSRNMILSHLCAFLTGLSANAWLEQHNQHHANANRHDMDPDINIPVLAFTEEQAMEKRGAARWIVRHQAYLFFPPFSREKSTYFWSSPRKKLL